MIKTKQNIVIIIAILLGMAIVVSCENDSEQIDKINSDEILPNVEMWNFERVNSEKGLETVRIKAPYMQSIVNDSTVYLLPKGFHMEIYGYLDGVKYIKSEISADSARYIKSLRLDAFKNVVVKNFEKDKLKTNFLSWDEKKEYISTTDSFRITGPTRDIHGVGLEGKQDFTDYTIYKTTAIIHKYDQ